MAKTDTKVDDGFVLNFADVKDNTFEALPAGRYHVRITDVERKETGENSKNPGTPMIRVEYTIVQDGEYKNRRVWDNLVLSQSSLWKTKQLVVAAGAVTKEEAESSSFNFKPEEMLHGRELFVKLDIQPARKVNGKEYAASNQVKAFYPFKAEGKALRP
jgi:hypothetical protein